ncbi:MAG: alanine dehydrogenase [Chloroflexi bacterium]|jgi:alanine dehydrogenase|nr:MAG: alanine dehydrogenase [Chloroflexi bacterium OLB13]MBC6957295.1 alanine dehydrogenase [Chloroflexota bacterium]MBV6436471.1 Alanine dehydrogenase 2 [Anaerolineae bacterium]MDL1916736.1 alanine dehydrogenase [Anaerolineae bacterium CFX4]OQY84709.1 MAG: alanine dehydrogenase [Anaerolineae bacterium UTCFX5]
MIIGIPKEIKIDENRVSLSPSAVGQLALHGHTVYVEANAGIGSAFNDAEYVRAGAHILDSAADIWSKADMVVKVKEPQPEEYPHLREGLILFTYLHLAADRDLTHVMLDSGVTGVAYETVTDSHGKLPLLEPMSEVAGRMSIQVAAHYLEKKQGGRGTLMGGVAGTPPAHVVVLGGGTVGANAARIALGMGAEVTLLDINLDRLRYLDDTMHGRFSTLYSSDGNIAQAITAADVVIGGVLITGAKAPRLIRRDMLKSMPDGSVIVDVAVDQGGCVETTRPTTHSAPTYVIDGVVHYGVANMPGAVPRTSSLALSNATLRYVVQIAELGLAEAMKRDKGLANGLNLHAGHVTHAAVAETFDLPYTAMPVPA